MKTRLFPHHLRLPLLGLLCGALGWLLRDATTSHSAGSASHDTMIASERGDSAEKSSLSRSASVSAARPAHVGKMPDGISRMQSTDPSDMLAMLEAIGAMTRMSDEEAKTAWLELAKQTPVPGFGNSLGVLYLWSRMTRMGESVDVPQGWGAEQYQAAIETEQVRGMLPQLLKRMEAGEGLSEAERRVVLTDTMRKNPLKAVELWCLSTRPEDYRNDAKWLGDALSDPGARDAIMARVREWQAKGDLAGAVSMLANRWISKDPAAVERWLQEPAQADLRSGLMAEVANARALAEPAEAWKWSATLEGNERLQALRTGAMQLAVRDPDNGIRLIAGLEDPVERETAVKNFANILASRDYDKWQAWRDSLAPGEQAMANESSFALWVNMDVDQAAGWLAKQAKGTSRDEMVGMLVNYYAGRDPETCSEWIRSISDADRRKDAAGAALSNVGPYDFDKIRVILAAVD